MTIYFLLIIQTPGSPSALQNVKISLFSNLLWFLFIFLDPDFTDSTELGSYPDPDPKRWKKGLMMFKIKDNDGTAETKRSHNVLEAMLLHL